MPPQARAALDEQQVRPGRTITEQDEHRRLAAT